MLINCLRSLINHRPAQQSLLTLSPPLPPAGDDVRVLGAAGGARACSPPPRLAGAPPTRRPLRRFAGTS